jgi:hypothetical protein
MMIARIPLVARNQAKALHGFDYVVDPKDLTQPVLRPVLDYWQQKCHGRTLPRRIDIDPQELKPYLRHLFLIEVLAGAEFRYRLIGSEITERYGRNSTGRTLREIYAATPAIADWLSDMLGAVVATGGPVLATGPLAAVNKAHIVSQSLHLPLADDGETVSMIFGAARYFVHRRY